MKKENGYRMTLNRRLNISGNGGISCMTNEQRRYLKGMKKRRRAS